MSWKAGSGFNTGAFAFSGCAAQPDQRRRPRQIFCLRHFRQKSASWAHEPSVPSGCRLPAVNHAQIQRRLQEGRALQQAGKLPEAAAIFAELRATAAANFDAWHLGGNIALLRGDPAGAAPLYARALRINPRSALAATCLGVARLALGDLAAAESHLRTALRLEPRNAGIWDQLATVLSTAGRAEEALTCHRQAVTFNPKSAQAWHGYGATLANLNHAAEALDCEVRALAADPGYAPARRGYAVALQKNHRVPEAVRAYEALLTQFPRQLDVQSHRLFALNYLATPTPADLGAAHKAYGALVETGAATVEFANTPDPDRPLRVAIFSADFREHSVAYFLEPILRGLDRSQFALLLYHLGGKADAVTERFRQLATVWRDCPSQIEGVLEPVIRADAPDIAVDLGGHTGQSLLPLFARRLAPVQISYLGSPNTTGLTAMDYRLVDAITDPVGIADPLHTETLVRFAPTAWAYAAPPDAPAPAPPPCRERGTVTFGSFNNFSKVTDEVMRLWAQLLGTVPGSRLLLKSVGLSDPGIAAHALDRLRQAGLPDGRVDLAGVTATTSEHLAAYARIDVALDTLPYNGTTTTCEALWMGVPVVTLAGDRHAARVGASLLQAVGHPEWIATDPNSYVRIAAELAADPVRLATLRSDLRASMQSSILLDHAGQSARFGRALRDCWRRWCAARTA